jgi:branched-chain amino acid transport system permease protein
MASAAMMGAGGYAAAVSLSRWDLNFWLQILLAFGVAVVLALVLGFITLRTSSSYFVILTLVLSQLVVLIFTNWKDVTNGQLGIVTSKPPSSVLSVSFANPTPFYYLTLFFLLLTMAGLWLVGRSSYGHRLVAIRENESLARSLGINAFREKLLAFMLFGGISGVAGALLFYYLRFIDPTTFSVTTSINTPLIVLLGGISARIGPVVGAAAFAILPDVMGLSAVQSALAYGIILVALMVIMPMGIGGVLRRIIVSWRWRNFQLRRGAPTGSDLTPDADVRVNAV